MRVETLDRLQTPRLALLPLGFGPRHSVPIGIENEARARIGDLDPVTSRFIDIEKKRLLNGMFMRPGFDIDTVLKKNIRGL